MKAVKFVVLFALVLLLSGSYKTADAEQWTSTSDWHGKVTLLTLLPPDDIEAREYSGSYSPPHVTASTSRAGAVARVAAVGTIIFTWSGPGTAASLSVTLDTKVSGSATPAGSPPYAGAISTADVQSVQGHAPVDYPNNSSPASTWHTTLTIIYHNATPGFTATFTQSASAYAFNRFAMAFGDANATP